MTPVALPDSPAVRTRSQEYFRAFGDDLARRVDKMMIWLLALEWFGAMAAALVLSPRNWEGARALWHPHLLAAILAGPAFILPTILTASWYPGRAITRHLIAVAQMLVSALLIEVTGGRVETHFHVFGSLAFLACYRDWRVLVVATAVTAGDHAIRGYWWPHSIYGLSTVSPYRWLEHAWWVVFEDFFLILAMRRSTQDMREVALGKSQLYEGAYHDVLTGLANRRLLRERFDALVEDCPAASRAVVFLDLDRFKQANDTLGHTVGDKLLVEAGARLLSILGKDRLLARVGGDEFVVLLDGANPEAAAQVAGSLLRGLAQPFKIDEHTLLLSATAGIAVSPEHGETLASLQEHADRAMYVAKSQGRNRVVVYSAEIEEREETLRDIARDLYAALPREQLRLEFQPLVGRAEQLCGFEALLRWNHPKHGAISPSEFVPIAERSGIIVEIGEWVLREACRACKAWQRTGRKPVRVAVNVSATQFEQPGFAATVAGILRDTGLDPALLTLELTEGVLVRNMSRTGAHLATLKKLGIEIALDDFGTGYSSLSYLTDLPANVIKIDRSFVQHEFGRPSNLLGSIVQMAHKLGLRVVAEGVESPSQAAWLLGLDCDELQGYVYSRPMAAGLVPSYIASGDYDPEAAAREPALCEHVVCQPATLTTMATCGPP